MKSIAQTKIMTPWKHQAEVIPSLVNNQEFCLFWEPGCGKSGAMIHALRHIYTGNAGIMPTLIIAPLIVLRNWKNEFSLHSKIPADRITVLDQSGKKRLEEFSKMRAKFPGGDFIAITNYESAQMAGLQTAFLNWAPEIVILDESHRVKNPKSKRARAILKIARRGKRRYLLTGTPILNSALDIFMQFRILEGDRPLFDRLTHLPVKGATFGDNYFAFRGMYFQDTNAAWKDKQKYFPAWEPRPDTHVALNKLISRKSRRILKKDCLDLPPMVHQTINVSMSAEQKRIYNEMKKHYLAFVETKAGQSKAVVAQLAITKALRLQQICSGFVKTDDDKEIPLKENTRAKALSELLVDIVPAHKVIVWAVFRYNYKQIEEVCAKLDLKYGLIVGDLSSKEKNASIDAFQNDPDTRVMIANQGAGGIGINLTAASHSIFYSRNFSLEADIQAEARNYRGGSEIHKSITRIDLVAPGTIDALVLDSLAKKQKVSDQILEWKGRI